MDLNEVSKQLSLIRIVWNASSNELIEAFSMFSCEKIDFTNLDDNISKASYFFNILAIYITKLEDYEHLMDCMYYNLKGL